MVLHSQDLHEAWLAHRGGNKTSKTEEWAFVEKHTKNFEDGAGSIKIFTEPEQYRQVTV